MLLQSQHEDMQSEYQRLMKEHEDEAEDHKLIDEQRNQEYNQFKQEKILEVSNLKGGLFEVLSDCMFMHIGVNDTAKIYFSSRSGEVKEICEGFNRFNPDSGLLYLWYLSML